MQLADFDNDIFISYAHLDNDTPSEEQEGWITHFHKCLEFRVSQLYGEKPRIWRDLKLQGNDFFDDEIVDQFPKVAFLISIVSPRYLKSEWCIREVEAFQKAAELTGGIRVDNKARVFKVVKTPVPIEDHPSEIQGLLGYDFHKEDPSTGVPIEFDTLINPDTEKEYWKKLNDLARDISDLLTLLDKNGISDSGSAPSGKASIGKCVYLAESGYDLKEDYDAIKRELEAQDCVVLPDRTLTPVASEYVKEAQEMLARCDLSIHLIGKNAGIIPDGASKSITELQNEVAAGQSVRSNLQRLIWMPPQLQIENELHAQFVDTLRTDPDALMGADLLQTPLEDLKATIHKVLAPEPEPEPEEEPSGEAASGGSDLTYVYLICDKRDLDATRELEDCLYDQGFEVVVPVFEGDVKAVRKDHEDTLRTCDGVLLYYGAANELWLRAKLREISKIAGQGRSEEFLSKLIYIAGPETPEKERYRTREAAVVKQFGSLAEADLETFVAEMKQGKKR